VHLEVIANGEILMRRDMLRFADNLAVPAEGLMAAGVVLRHAIEQQFDSQGSHASGGWAPLADSTVAEKSRKGLRPEILRATDRLMQSLTSRFDSDHIEEMRGPDTLAFGSNVPYGAYHQTGTRKMPRRRPVALTEADKIEIMKAIQLATVRGVKAAGAAAV
jgi:phage gpG-like protein